MHHIVDLPSVVAMERALLAFHDAAGLPWWGTLCLATFCARTVAVPFQLLLTRNQLRVKVLRAETAALADVMADPASPPAEKRRAADAVDALFAKHQCHPLYAWDWVIPVAFPAFFLSYFAAINNLCLGDGTLRAGGTLWFPDLMAADVTNLLPIVSAVTWLAVVEGSAGQAYLASSTLKLCVVPA